VIRELLTLRSTAVLRKVRRSLNRCELDPCVYDIFYSESPLELNPEVVTLIPGTPCIWKVILGYFRTVNSTDCIRFWKDL